MAEKPKGPDFGLSDEVPKKIAVPEEALERLRELEGNIAESETIIERMEKLGMDASSLKEKIEWIKETKKVLEEIGS